MTENNSKPVDFNGKPIECNPEELSTNFYWTFGREEVFNVQTTVRGNPTPYEILAHLDAVHRDPGIGQQTDATGHHHRQDQRGELDDPTGGALTMRKLGGHDARTHN